MSENEEAKGIKKQVEKTLRGLEKKKQEREILYARLKGRIDGMRQRELGKTDTVFLAIVEAMVDMFKETADNIGTVTGLTLGSIRYTERLVDRVSELEGRVNELRKTLDTMEKWK